MGLHVEVRGQPGAPDLVMLHGWAMHGGVWGVFAGELEREFRLHIVDLPGHGFSPEGDVTLEALADAVLAQAPRQAAWLGWSLGGMVALAAARCAPARVSRLVLMATTPSFVRREGWPQAMDPELLEGFRRGLQEDAAATVKRFAALQAMGADDARPQTAWLRQQLAARPAARPTALRAGLDILADSDLRPQLAGLSQPVLLLAGASDPLLPAEAARQTATLLPDARLALVEGAAHAPFLSQPAATARMVAEFLRG